MKVTVRTLDSQSQTFDLEDDDITVKDFKLHIATTINIPADKQRIIFRGKVLHDNKKLKEYNVDGCVVHLVQRAPPTSESSSSTHQPNTTQNASSAFGATTSTEQLDGVAQHLVDSLISQFGAGNVSTSTRGNSLNVNISVQAPGSSESSDVVRRLGTARRFLSHAEHLVKHLVQPATMESSQSTDASSNGAHGAESSQSSENNSSCPHVNHNEPEQSENNTNEITPQSLSQVYHQFTHLYQHLLPSIERYEFLLNNPATTGRAPSDDLLPDQMAEIFHDLSHALHALSDLSFNFNSPNPQSLMCYPQISPVRFPPPMPHLLMTPSATDVQRTNVSTSTTSSVPAGNNQSNIRQMSGVHGQPRQRTPVAVASISTVVHIPAGSLSTLMRNATEGSSTTIPSSITQSSTVPTTANISSSQNGSNSTSTIPGSQNTTTSSTNAAQQMFQSFFGSGNLPSSASTQPTVQIGMGTSPQMSFIQNASNPFHINMNQQGGNSQTEVGGETNENAQLPLGLQNIMQSIMQNITGEQAATATSTESSTGNNAAPSGPMVTTSHPSTQPHHHHISSSTINSPNLHQHTHTQHHQPHPHHHHHNQDGSVMHPDSLLPCQSFHFGPTFHQAGHQHGHQHVVAEVSSIVIDDSTPTSVPYRVSTLGTWTPPALDSVVTENSTPQNQNTTDEAGTGSDIGSLSSMLNGIFGSMSGVSGSSGNSNTQTNQQAQMSVHIQAEDEDVDMDAGSDLGAQAMQQSLFQNILDLGNNSNSNTPGNRETLREFVQQHFGVTGSDYDDFLSEFIDVLSDNLSMADLVSIFFGSSTEPWNAMHTPLRKLVEKHFNNNAEITEDNITDVAATMADYVSEVTTEVEPHVTVRSDVDLKSSLKNIDKKYFEKLLRLLVSDASSFGRNVYDWYVEYYAWSFALLDYAVTGGADRFLTAVSDVPSVQRIFQDVTSPPLRQFMLQTIISRVRSSISSRHITSSELMATIVKPGAKITQRENPCKETSGERAAKRCKKNEKVDVNDLWEELNPSYEIPSESDPEADSPPSPEDWHSRIPNDWVLVINRDAERQRKMPPQRPYSDAYLSGLPPKRRKTMTKHSVEADRVDVGTSIKRVVEKTGLENKHDEKKLQSNIDDTDLQAMFETTLRHDIRQRLQADEDYRPLQHANSESYFMKGGNSK